MGFQGSLGAPWGPGPRSLGPRVLGPKGLRSPPGVRDHNFEVRDHQSKAKWHPGAIWMGPRVQQWQFRGRISRTLLPGPNQCFGARSGRPQGAQEGPRVRTGGHFPQILGPEGSMGAHGRPYGPPIGPPYSLWGGPKWPQAQLLFGELQDETLRRLLMKPGSPKADESVN